MGGIDEKQVDYQQLFYRMNEGFALCGVVCDENGEPYDCLFLDINPAFERLAGMNRDDILGRRCSETVLKEDLSWIKECIKATREGGSARADTYLSGLRGQYEVMAYQPAAGQIAAIFTEVNNSGKFEDESHLRLPRVWIYLQCKGYMQAK